jgi:D-galactose 1-dehydrogenase
MSNIIRLGLVGLGKIARDQHLPAIAAHPNLQLVAVASPNASPNASDKDVSYFADLAAMLRDGPAIDAVILCQPPQARYDAARMALLAGKHVFLEKPPGATVTEVEALIELSKTQGVTLFASWHSRYAAAVATTKAWLAAHPPRHIQINWKEDVRHWHPGQTWIWQAGGFGVFDPGINALSILTEIVSEPLRLISAELTTPSNCQAPIAATLTMQTASGQPIDAEFDFRQTGPQSWDIIIQTDAGRLVLGHGGNVLAIDGAVQPCTPEAEYPLMYAHFAQLVQTRQSDVDLAPLRLVADAFLCAKPYSTEAFHD